ncbi:MAG TPA: cell division protein FtsQ/DivIB [Burkholderiales bacterium]|nr:cell division protein FtsQ/DivIB [Burkholderiales bacterium]
MWDNPRLLNSAAGLLVGLAALVFAFAGLQLLLRSPLFPLRELEIKNALKQTSREEIEAAVRGRISGNFFAVELSGVRDALEQLPWVRRVTMRRVWPDRIEVFVEEHVALARWGDDALVNTYGERFAGRSEAVLPLFLGPAGTEQEVARRYARFASLVAPLGTGLERLVLTQRYAWQLRLGSGLNIMLGRDADSAELRLARFVAAYPATLGRIARPHDYVDLRYPNGFALRMPELRG